MEEEEEGEDEEEEEEEGGGGRRRKEEEGGRRRRKEEEESQCYSKREPNHWRVGKKQVAKQSQRKMPIRGYKLQSNHCVKCALGVTSCKAISA